MFDHVTVRAADQTRSGAFYRCLFESLGVEPSAVAPESIAWDDFWLIAADGEHPVTQHLHVGLVAGSREQVDRVWEGAVAAGHREDGAPGERTRYGPTYYGGFLLDPDGNSVEVVHHEDVRRGGHIDHLWVGIRDLDRSVAFYQTIARHAGLRLGAPAENRCPIRGAWATSAVVCDGRPPTSGLHLAFPAPDRRTVCEFHAAALAAGYRDNGPPGERPHYRAGYYAAFVLDPDGNNVESVCHGLAAGDPQ